jgi:hypothetical protein
MNPPFFFRLQGVCAALLLTLLALPLPQAQAKSSPMKSLAAWEHSIVTLEVSRKEYDYYQPWGKRTQRLQKTGIVLENNQILTTADELFDRTMIRLQKGGRGQWYVGDLVWIDYHANLALVTSKQLDFWTDLKPAKFGTDLPSDGSLQILRWREGNLESRRAEFGQYTEREGQLSSINQLVLEASSEIQGAGWSEPLVADSHIVGLLRAQDGRTCMAIPTSFLQPVLDARKQGKYRGLGFFHFVWQRTSNPATLESLQLDGPPRGVVIVHVPERPDHEPNVLKPKDIILQIDGFDIDVEGDYLDPEYGHVMLENLASRRKWAGDSVEIKLWRDGKPMTVNYEIPRFRFGDALVPHATYDQEPEFLILGGLVFQPLTDPYLQSWGPEWKRRAPYRLRYYGQQPPTANRPALILLSQVLPDPYNIGYQEVKFLVVDKINGQPVRRLTDVQSALKSPQNGFHIIDMVEGDSLRRIVVSAGDAETQATQRVLKRYGIEHSFRLAGKPAQ